MYAKGVNDFVAQMPAYPIEFYILGMKWEEWTVCDLILGYKMVKLSQNLYKITDPKILKRWEKV